MPNLPAALLTELTRAVHAGATLTVLPINLEREYQGGRYLGNPIWWALLDQDTEPPRLYWAWREPNYAERYYEFTAVEIDPIDSILRFSNAADDSQRLIIEPIFMLIARAPLDEWVRALPPDFDWREDGIRYVPPL